MTTLITKEQALEVHAALIAEHGDKDYFLKAEVVWADTGFGIDFRVDREKWQAAGCRAPGAVQRVHVCTLLHG